MLPVNLLPAMHYKAQPSLLALLFKDRTNRIAILISSLLVIIILFFFFRGYTIRSFAEIQASLSNNTIFYDIDGQPFHVIRGVEDRKYVKLSGISRNLQKAVVAVEDGRFFQHSGIDIIRIAGAIVRLLKLNTAVQGASTLTQQLVKLTLLTPERTLSRKITEIFMAIALETKYSKAEILEFYLNKVYLGHQNYGVENASLNYFHKSSNNLTIAESSFIAGLIKKPEGYSPFVNIKKARFRQIYVLKRLLKLNWITKEEYQAAINEEILIRQKKDTDMQNAPYFINHVLLQLKEKYGHKTVYGGGLKIYTTLDVNLQSKLEKTIKERMSKARSFEQVAAISIDPNTGFVKALVGGLDFEKSEFNRATQALRQPGSAFKPILYATALEKGLKITDTFVDEPIQYTNENQEELEVYEPTNFMNDNLGTITLGHALTVSNNVVSVQILNKIGISSLVFSAKKFGIELPLTSGLCLALGCGETSLMNLTNAYTAFANNGFLHQPVFVLKINDKYGNQLEENQFTPNLQIIPDYVAYQINRLLQNVVIYGTGKNAKISRKSGGKTGTSDNFRDAWYIGYTPELITGFWIGNDDNTPMDEEVGGRTPARMWRNYMESLNLSAYQQNFAINEKFDEYQVCAFSGKLATNWCPIVYWYPIDKQTEFNTYCDIHNEPDLQIKICTESGKLATEYCPTDQIETKNFIQGSEPKDFCSIHKASPKINKESSTPAR